MNDDDIVERLRRAARGDTRPDLADVEARSRRIHTRRRTIAGVAAAVLVAGAGGIGFGIGQAIGEDDGEQLTAAGAPLEPPMPTTTVAAAEESTADTVVASTTVPLSTAADDAAASIEAGATDAGPGLEGDVGRYGPEYTLLVDRTTDAGVRVRASRSERYSHDTFVDDASGWQPAAWCNASADIRVGVAAPGVIDVSGAPWYDELPPGADVIASPLTLGFTDAQWIVVVVVQGSSDVVEVAATAHGVTDRAAAVDGVAVVALVSSDGPDAVSPDAVTVDVTTTDGTTRSFPATELFPYASRAWQEGCTPPPPALPPAGEQPADAEAAEAEIRQRFQLLRDRSIPREEKPDLLDDRTGVDAAIDAVDTGQYADVVATATSTIDELVFTSPTEAWFRYTIDTSSGVFGGRYGTVHLIDGSWRFARAVVCQDLALAGASCDPPVEPILPPSAQIAERCWEVTDGMMCEAATSVAVEE